MSYSKIEEITTNLWGKYNVRFSANADVNIIVGINGSGKTTLMNMLSGIYYPDGGEVYINGELVSTISCSESFPEEAFHIMPGGSTVKYMRDFRFYDRALTADEIAVVMREGE